MLAVLVSRSAVMVEVFSKPSNLMVVVSKGCSEKALVAVAPTVTSVRVVITVRRLEPRSCQQFLRLDIKICFHSIEENGVPCIKESI